MGGAICTVETEVRKSMVVTPSLKMNELKQPQSEAYISNDEWQETPGLPEVPQDPDPVQEASFAVTVKAAKTEASGVTHPALLGRTREDTVGTKLSIQSSEYMGPIESSSSSM
ncbi:unnamed protein product [Cladocopium goreaui]|uniref:Uncharacterized protein n=1 Tax=Cladocopium goreaui TaxID=2562237 RepID=A0A9P1GB97_9DINO|nr:unnamed protein product [Cladocopium goreaui]|mmetsp:Transcript_72472/g.160088  ORF Transcript_72472/g.160088 Transcript_72472/m.160088 type:complete len:113 (+) Transcript_72472:70-408(+)